MNETSRADMHVHSTASELSKLGIQRSLQLPECATKPAEVYELAKRRGMDFVTITDHDTIDGVLEIAHLPDVFVSEELTAWFKGEAQAVHVLCYGITPEHHEWLQAHSDDVETCAAYLAEHEVTCALAHPFYAVEAPLTPRHRRRLAQLFPIWETRNGSRAKELNRPAFVYIETHGGTAIGGSDDHAGIDIGRTFTETPQALSPREFLAHIRAGRGGAHGSQGSAAKWTHAAMALAIRLYGDGTARAERPRPDPTSVLKIVERVMSEGNVRRGSTRSDLGPQDGLALLHAWLRSMDLSGAGPDGPGNERELLRLLQDGELSHPDLQRRARRIHERRLAGVVEDAAATLGDSDGPEDSLPRILAYAHAAFDACVPAIPYAAAAAFLGREKGRLTRNDGDRPRVALVADGIGATHGVATAVAQIRERGVPGFDLEVIGTDADVDRRLSAVAEVEVPFYPGLKVGVPSVPALTEALADGNYDLVHVTAPGPAGAGAWLLARVLELPLLGSYHTELAAYAGVRSGQAQLEALTAFALGRFYAGCDVVLSPSPASDRRLAEMGVDPGIVARWDRGVDPGRFDPALRREGWLPGELNVLYAGRLTSEKGVEMLAEAFLRAAAEDDRLHLVLAGGGPEEGALRARLGHRATFLGWLRGRELAEAYASADMFLFASRTDTFGQVILEAQASGLPVVAVGEGGPRTLIEHGVTGLLTEGDPRSLADAVVSLAAAPRLRRRLGGAGLQAVAGRSWESALAGLSAGYRRALSVRAGASGRQAA